MAGLEEKQGDWIFDLRDRPAVIIQVSREASGEQLDRFEQELRNLSAAVARHDHDDSPHATPQVGRYQIGSAAEWTYTFAIAWDAVQQAPDLLAQAVDWTERIEFLIGKLKPTSPDAVSDEESNGNTPLSIRPEEVGITPQGIIPLVVSHFLATYGPSERLKLSWFVRGPGYGVNLSQPSGSELYTLDVHDDSSHYIYIVTGSAIPVEHFLLSSGRLHPLEEPQWLGQEPSDTFRVQESAFHSVNMA